MEAFGPFLNGYANAGMQLWEHLRAKTFAALDAHALLKSGMKSPDDVRRRADYVRNTFLESLGGLPECRSPVKARIVGCVERLGYRIEKVVYESLPSVYVTALLYDPERLDGRAPGILFLCGHHLEAKGNPEYQRVCHDLVTNGFVALAIDPTGQGERISHIDPETGAMSIGWGTTEHNYQGQQCILTGTNIARYFLFDALRGIDYLQSRSEVDPKLIGVTGNSGGGTQTSLVCMCGDPRVKAAAPCTYVTSREHYFMTGQPQDCEQLQFAMTRNGINFDDFFIPFAPRPLLIGAVESDFFNPEGTDLTFERLQRIYGLFGQEKAVARVFAPGQHAYCRGLRQAVVNWFREHLLGVAPDFVSPPDEDIETLANAALWCTGKGHVRTKYPDHRTPYHLNLDAIPRRSPSADLGALRTRVISVLGMQERLDSKIPLYPRMLSDAQLRWKGVYLDPVFFRSEPDIMVSGCFLRLGPENKRKAILRLTTGGTRNIDSEAERYQASGCIDEDVFVFDVRGTGAVSPHPVNPHQDTFPASFFNTEAWFAFSAYCLGESLLGMRVFDVIRSVDYLCHEAGYTAVRLDAAGLGSCLWGYLAAAIDLRIEEVCLDDLVESFEAIARTELYRTDFAPAMLVHGILKEFDLPDLRPLFSDRVLRINVTGAQMRA